METNALPSRPFHRWRPGAGLEDRAAPEGPALNAGDVQLLALVASGLAPDAVARRLGVSSRTVRRRLARICDRLGVASPVQCVVWAVRRGLV